MKLHLYLSVEGLERVALGNPLSSWHFSTVDDPSYLPTGAMIVGELEFELPPASACIRPVLEKLAVREQEIQAEAYKEIMELKERRENLLSLTYAAPTEVQDA